MAARRRHIARERNKMGLTNFIDSLRSLFVQIQQINTQYIDSDYLEMTQSHLEDTIVLLKLLLANIEQTQDHHFRRF